MDFSYAEDDNEAELQAVEQQHVIRRYYTCGSTKHLRPGCPLRRQRQTPPNQNFTPGQKSGMARGNGNTQ